MDRIIGHLKNSKEAFLATHTNPDGDAIGSLLALGGALQRLGCGTLLYDASPVPAVYQFLPSVERVVRELPPEECRFDLAVVLDCGNVRRIGEDALQRIDGIPTIINIDHHITNTGFGTLQAVDSSACATSEIIYRLIRKLEVPIDPAMATAIYTGILTDTGSFRFSNTNRAAFEICEKMIAAGADPYHVAQHVYGTYSLGRIKLLNLALDSIEISKNGKMSMMSLTRNMLRETGTQPEDIDGLINYARRIQDVRVAVLIQELENGVESSGSRHRYHVSLRSDGTVDVSRIAAAYGGGGHSSAAGFSTEQPFSELKSHLLHLAKEF